jgi:5-methylcytosine-specific restriction endonuclease McrA
MKKHIRIYMDAFRYSSGDFIPCEICGRQATDIHHIQRRGMGGSATADRIENLMAVCRSCHEMYGDKLQHKDWLRDIHRETMLSAGVHMLK